MAYKLLNEAEHDPVFFDTETGQYGFYDETWAYDYGPFPTEEEARAALARYVESL